MELTALIILYSLIILSVALRTVERRGQPTLSVAVVYSVLLFEGMRDDEVCVEVEASERHCALNTMFCEAKLFPGNLISGNVSISRK